VSPAAWQALLDACHPTLIHTHVAEFPDEVRYLQGKPSAILELHRTVLAQTYAPQATVESPVAYLRQFNLLNHHTVAAHAIETTATDRAILAETGTTIAHCPRSNLALHGKTLTAAEWDDIPMGLGTDGRLSTENLDLRAEARCAQQLHDWDAKHALEALTLHGAQALHLEKNIGSLEIGKQADWVLWQAAQPELGPPEAMVLDERTIVEEVWIAGGCQWRRTTT
jgi:cytosine/adenosine deaminase-related metal-dependent hydrolase